MPACDHCLLEVSDRDVVRDAVDGTEHVFCCNGCRGIYRLIHAEGLDDFYTRRGDWTPGPANPAHADVSLFLEGLRPVGPEIETDIVIDGIRCASCVWLNEKILSRTPGISTALVNYATHRARIRWDPARLEIRDILDRIQSIGYTPKPFQRNAFDEEQRKASRDLLIRFGTAAFFSMQLMLFSVALYAGYFQGIDDKTRYLFHMIAFAFTTPVLFYSGLPILKGALQGLRHLAFNMDVLIATGALAAYGYSIAQIFANAEVYFDTAAMIITLILLGRCIEAGARTRASEAVTRLLQLNPKEARRLELSQETADQSALQMAPRLMTLVSKVLPGDLIEVLPGEKVPLDGVVVSGVSEVDESMLTGESKPSTKSVSSPVYSGTLNMFGSFLFKVTKVGKETILGQIIQAVEDAQSRRAPIQSTADRVVGWFVPAIIVVAFITLAAWLAAGAATSTAVINAISVLVIACPCALGLATPLAILIATSQASTRGVLIKGGDVIEKAAAVDQVVLDKTGTITEGRSMLTAYRGITLSDQEALLLVASVEKKSEHAVGKAIAAAAHAQDLFEVAGFSASPGRGVRGTVACGDTVIGNKDYIQEVLGLTSLDSHIPPDVAVLIKEQENMGSTIVYAGYEGKLCGVFAIADRVRDEASEAISQLRKQGLSVSMITGDAENAARSVADKTGIEQVKAQVLPLGKVEAVRELQKNGKRVMMVGDGINDAPALVESSVGAAMGRATDVALESADIVIMRPDLRLVAYATALTRKTFSVIRQNIFWAFFYNSVAIPLAIFGLLHPIVAAGSMAFSSLSVVGNSLRLRVR